jgi:hypothetical protein
MASTRFAGATIEPPSKNVRPMVVRQLRQMLVYPGQSIAFQDVDWDEFEAIGFNDLQTERSWRWS